MRILDLFRELLDKVSIIASPRGSLFSQQVQTLNIFLSACHLFTLFLLDLALLFEFRIDLPLFSLLYDTLSVLYLLPLLLLAIADLLLLADLLGLLLLPLSSDSGVSLVS